MIKPAISSVTSPSILLFVLLAFSITSSALIAIGGQGTAKAAYPTIPVGTNPGGIAFDSANGNLYVANEGDNTVSVISGATNQVVGSPIPVGAMYTTNPNGITFDPANGEIYVANFYSKTVSVISGSTNQVIATIPLNMQPQQIAFDSANKNMYIAGVNQTSVPYSHSAQLSVISGSTNQVIATTPLPGGSVGGITFDPANGNMYITSQVPSPQNEEDALFVFSTSSNKVIATLGFSGPEAVAFDPANGDVYVYEGRSNTLQVIDPATNKVVALIHAIAVGIAFDPANGNLYTTGLSTVSVISSSTNQVIATLPVGTYSQGIAYDSANGNMYVVNYGDNDVSVIATGNTPTHATTLTLNTINSVPWSSTVTVTGKLTNNTASGQGIAGRTITFTSPNSSPVPPSATTGTDGTFSSSFKSSRTVFSGWQLQAYFAGDSNYLAANSAVRSYNTVKHTTSLYLHSVASSIPWGTTVTLSGNLYDASNSSIGVASKTITFTTSNGSPLPASSVTTASDGTYKTTFTASNTLFSGWNIQAHFAGDTLYNTTSSSVRTYNTVKHNTALTLVISPTSVAPSGTYSLSGTLRDTSASGGLVSKTITFTATSPIKISSQTTNSLGQYSATGLIAPSTTGTYSIQSHYAGESLYNAANSPTQTLTVSTTAAAATVTPTAKMASTSTSTTPSSGSPKATAAPAANTSSINSRSPLSPSPSLSLTPHSSTNTNTNTNSNHTAQSASAKKLSLTSSPSLLPLKSTPSLQSQPSSPPLTSSSNNNNLVENSVSPAFSSSSSSSQLQKQQLPQLQQQQLTPYSSYRYPYPSQSPSYPYSSQQQQPLQPPIANAGISQAVYENTKVVLDGTKSYDPNPGSSIVGYQWTQLSTTGGVQVTLIGANTAIPYFVAPNLPNDNTILSFNLRVMDNHGAVSTNPAMVYVMVKHNPNNIGPTTGTIIIQPQQQQQQQSHQPNIPNNNEISPSPRISNSAPPSSLPQIGLPTIRNPVAP